MLQEIVRHQQRDPLGNSYKRNQKPCSFTVEVGRWDRQSDLQDLGVCALAMTAVCRQYRQATQDTVPCMYEPRFGLERSPFQTLPPFSGFCWASQEVQALSSICFLFLFFYIVPKFSDSACKTSDMSNHFF